MLEKMELLKSANDTSKDILCTAYIKKSTHLNSGVPKLDNI